MPSGKSWNLLGNDADATMTCIYGTPCVNGCKKCSNSYFAISLQHVTVMNIYSSIDAAVILHTCIWLITAVCFHI